MARLWLVWVWVLCLAACDGAPAPMLDASTPEDAAPAVDAGPPEDLDGYLEWQMRAGGIPGAAMAIVKGTEIAWVGTYGYADLEAMREVDEHTLFIVASISKTMAAVRALQLVEAGMLDLDAPLETYLPYGVRHPAHADVPITTRMLLTHVTGLEDNWPMLGRATTYGTDPTETLAGFAEGYVTPGGAYYAEGSWGSAPMTRRTYCNAAFGVVGDVIERAGGASFRAQTSAGIFDVLAMDGAGWFLEDVSAEHLATPYGWNGRRFSPLPQNGFAFYPASSLRVSVTGLARFALAIANGGALDGARVLSEESVTELLRAQVPDLDRGQALTFSDRSVNGHLYVGHSGSTFGGSAQMLLSREGDHGILLLTNGDAYVRAELGLEDGAIAMEAILRRLDEEAHRL
ncbi:MAG: beta-lactamase family protein [Sandaracinaceae bacterium]|nr:beta-lactamase family protein [Sandaracinaceae bacterium]